LNSVETGFIFC